MRLRTAYRLGETAPKTELIPDRIAPAAMRNQE